MNLFEGRLHKDRLANVLPLLETKVHQMNPNRSEPTPQENAYANRNHEAKVQPMDLQLKNARCGINPINSRAYMVVADSASVANVFVADFYFNDAFDDRNRARYLAEQLCLQINNATS